MSVELLTECKKKLTTALSKLDKTILERTFYETCRSETIIQDSKDSLQQARQELKKNSVRIKELNRKVQQNLAE